MRIDITRDNLIINGKNNTYSAISILADCLKIYKFGKTQIINYTIDLDVYKNGTPKVRNGIVIFKHYRDKNNLLKNE